MLINEDVRKGLIQILGKTNFSLNGERFGLHVLVEAFSRLKQEERDEVLRYGRLLSMTDKELAFHFFLSAPELLREISIEQIPVLVDKEIEYYDKIGGVTKEGYFNYGSPERIRELSYQGLELKKVEGLLKLYVNAIGKGLILHEGEEVYTDTIAIFLPSRINISDSDDQNLKAYKAIIAHKYGQVKYGTFKLKLDDIRLPVKFPIDKKGCSTVKAGSKDAPSDFENFFNLFPEKDLALDIYMILENMRVDRLLCKEFNGFARDINLFRESAMRERGDINALPPKKMVVEGLLRCLLDPVNSNDLINDMPALKEILAVAKDVIDAEDSCSSDSANATIKIYQVMDDTIGGQYAKLKPIFYYGIIKPEKITEAEAFINKTIKEAIEELKSERNKNGKSNFIKGQDDRLKLRNSGWDIKEEKNFTDNELENMGGDGEYLLLEEKSADSLSDEIKERIENELTDLGEIDSSLLMRTISRVGERFKASFQSPSSDANIEAIIEKGPGIFIYNEWDAKKGRYRREWCALREVAVEEGSERAAEEMLSKYAYMVASFRRQFEAMRVEAKRLRRQSIGDDIDTDAVVEMIADIKAGSMPSDDLYINTQKDRRDIASAILVDVSGSTDGWVLDTEKGALMLLSEALNEVKDKYAIYAFSSKTRANCSFHIVKDFKERYNEAVRRRIVGLKAGDYTRMGAPIRHLSKLMEEIDARRKIMIILSDGKPEDYDEYKGEHGIEDTRMALMEAKMKGITTFCITIDKEGAGYLPRMYGEVNYTIINSVESLPLRLPQIYRKLTG